MQNKLTISAIKQLCNQNPDCFFFSKDTMRFYRQARAQYTVKYVNGINYVIVSYQVPETNIHNLAEYELKEKSGRYSLESVDCIPEKIKEVA
jgi:hypothetical protein